jgi:hypothetical protein
MIREPARGTARDKAAEVHEIQGVEHWVSSFNPRRVMALLHFISQETLLQHEGIQAVDRLPHQFTSQLCHVGVVRLVLGIGFVFHRDRQATEHRFGLGQVAAFGLDRFVQSLGDGYAVNVFRGASLMHSTPPSPGSRSSSHGHTSIQQPIR